MYYDDKNKILIDQLPKNSIGPNGQFVFNFDTLNDINLWANHNYYTVRHDNPSPGVDYVEDETQRTITLDKPYADISRVWVKNSVPEVENNSLPNNSSPDNPIEE